MEKIATLSKWIKSLLLFLAVLQLVNYLSYIALTCLAWLIISLLYPLLITLVLRISGLSDSMSFYFSLGSSELYYALTGLVVYCIAWVMKHAVQLQEEAELTI